MDKVVNNWTVGVELIQSHHIKELHYEMFQPLLVMKNILDWRTILGDFLLLSHTLYKNKLNAEQQIILNTCCS